MATVPRYDVPQEAPQALGTPRLDSIASPEDFGGIAAKRDAQGGQALLAAGTGASAIAFRMKTREDQDAVFQAETAVKEAYLKYEADARQNRQGALAKGLTQDTAKWWDDAIAKHSANLGNDDQRRAFAQRLTPARLSSSHGVSVFEQQQRERSADESMDASHNTSISTAAASGSKADVAFATRLIQNDYAAAGARKGWTAEVLIDRTRKKLTELHVGVFNNLIERDYEGAKNYITEAKAKGEIDGRTYDELDKRLREGGMDTLAQNFGDDAIARGLTAEQALTEARAKFKGKEEEHVVARLKQRYKEQSDAVESAINKAYLGGRSLVQIQAMPEWGKMDGEAQRKFVSFVTNQAYTNEARAAARESRAWTAEQRKAAQQHQATWANFFSYSDPERLKGMSRDQVANLLPDLGAQHTAALLSRWDSLEKNPAKFTEGKIDRDLFNTIAQEFDLKPYDSKRSTEDKARLGQLLNAVEQEIGKVQTETKKVLTREDKEKVMRGVIAREIKVSPWYSVGGMFDSTKPAALVLPKDLGTVVVPPTDRAAIEQALKARGLQVNDKTVKQWYLVGQQRGVR